MSEPTATPAAPASTTTSRRATGASRRRGPAKTAGTTGPALPPEREDAFQATPRIWPD